MEEFKSIKSWSAEERPREKLRNKGADSLTDIEIVAILINTGTKNKSAIDIARDILTTCNANLLELGKLTLKEIQQYKGIGEKKAITLLAALELGKRRQLSLAVDRTQLTTSKQAFELFNAYLVDKLVEEFYVCFLSASSKCISIELLSQGGLTATVVDVRVLFTKAFALKGVTQIILAHNHPSGSLRPSEADKQLTQKIKQAAQVLDIKLLDHLIIAGNDFYSFSDNGLL
jgi:DNA repair protein RadC